MKTITLVLLVALALAACGGCDEKTTTAAEPFGITFVSIEYSHANEFQAYGWYVLTMKITGPSVVQELRMERNFIPPAQAQLVEYFAAGAGEDVHSGFRGEIREMLLYPAGVEGADLVNGWAILAANESGSFITSDNAVLELGGNYTGRVPQGRAVSTDTSKAIHWRTEARDDRVYLWIDGVEHPIPAP